MEPLPHSGSAVSPWDTDIPTIYDRFPGRSGKALMQVARKIYGANSATIPFFVNVNGKQVQHIFRHPLNDRDQADARSAYMEQIKADGVIQECRGEIIGVLLTEAEAARSASLYKYGCNGYKPQDQADLNCDLQGPTGPKHMYLVAGATLIEAAYMAHQDSPNLQNVKLTIASGVKVSILEPRSPPDILQYFMDEMNARNAIFSQTNIIQCYNLSVLRVNTLQIVACSDSKMVIKLILKSNF